MLTGSMISNLIYPFKKSKKVKSTILAMEIINKEQFNKESLNIFENSKKKDDLADSFLQCIWYLKSKNLINMDISKLNI